jgi:hypothetical protein
MAYNYNKRARMAIWEGHKQATSAALLVLLTKASAGGASFSYAEQVLFVACEFWAAVRNRTLHDYLTDDAHTKIREAEEAFRAMRLTGVGALLRQGYLESTGADPPQSLAQTAANMEDKLAHIEGPVDEAIEQFVCRWLSYPR